MAGKQPEILKGRRVSALKRQTEGIASKPVSNVIGKRVRQARLSQELTLQVLYERIQIESGFEMGQPTLTRIELGTRSVYDYEVAALARALQVDARWLLGLIDQP
ncbi:helix-turn-helix transcriptional regulator (plasmid) [Deinococcus sp. KNUC1210]|uniref:helix-turn-helix domain-containing protein n=1 Tax=Deinococcus sp. KNUC1210 TaxID=2917691 RepID=UPI001EF020FD|nr:helix-turn-helix transcriptional regulator [Deinococcus sp. KNUC1210]ULH13972.1 helix-turn-helix transcriptional regulator [Deinococcus sp. KNUC1210]